MEDNMGSVDEGCISDGEVCADLGDPMIGEALSAHPLAGMEFLEDGGMLDVRAQRRAEMEKIEADPAAYIAANKVATARAKAARIMSTLKTRRAAVDELIDNEESDGVIESDRSDGSVDVEEVMDACTTGSQIQTQHKNQNQNKKHTQKSKVKAVSIVGDVSDDGDVELEGDVIGPGGIPDYEHTDATVSVGSGTVINIYNVRKLVIRLN
jgi:hypothetical protein